MKLRIRGDSVRLRLTKAEVQQISEGKFVQETTHFLGGTTFHYVLDPSTSTQKIEARYADNRMVIALPMIQAQTWAKSNEVALQFDQETAAPNKLFILIEKDFACLKPRQHEHEDESDMFFNPNSLKGTCG